MKRGGLLLEKFADRIAEAFEVGVEESAWNHDEPQQNCVVVVKPVLTVGTAALNDEKRQSG
jgi:hypothetical protein